MASSPTPPAIKPLAQFVLGNAIADIYAMAAGVAPNSIAEIYTVWIANTDTVARLVTLRYGPVGALVAPGNSLGELWSIAANTTWEFDGSSAYLLVLRATDHLAGFADVANKVTITLFGQETSN